MSDFGKRLENGLDAFLLRNNWMTDNDLLDLIRAANSVPALGGEIRAQPSALASQPSNEGCAPSGAGVDLAALLRAYRPYADDYARQHHSASNLCTRAADHIDAQAAMIKALEREVDHFTRSGIVEVAVRNASVAEYMRHWEGRALKAEAALSHRPPASGSEGRDGEGK